MRFDRRVSAQASMLVVIGAMFLTWSTAGDVSGTGVAEGQVAAVASLITMALVQFDLRPAWIGGGFVAALLGRQLLDLGSDAGIGLWLGTVAAVVATVLLVWNMFANIPRPD